MDKKKTLSAYLYNALTSQIKSGKLEYGEKLPAMRTLCEIYNVGIRTVRDVMKILADEGYIESVQRSHMRVVYRMEGIEATDLCNARVVDS